MTIERKEMIEQMLIERGYKRYNTEIYSTEIYSTEDYDLCKSFYESDGEKRKEYIVIVQFWNFGKYPQVKEPDAAWSISYVVLPCCNNRADLLISNHEISIEKVEDIAKDFYLLTHQHQL